MKKLILIIVASFLFTGCATVSHKHIATEVQWLGGSVKYQSQVAIDGKDIPAFVKAVAQLEKLLRGDYE